MTLPAAGNGPLEALRARWLGTVPYATALEVQRALFERSAGSHLLLLEHPPVYTLGARARPEHLLSGPNGLGAEVVHTDRGGDVTFHGPGQLVGYPVVSVPFRRGVVPDYVHRVEQVVLDALADLGIEGPERRGGFPGLWFLDGPVARKVCAVGVRMSRGRTMHGFALNVTTDLSWFDGIVPCGITGVRTTSLAAEGFELCVGDVAAAVAHRAALAWGDGTLDFQACRPHRPNRAPHTWAPATRESEARESESRESEARASEARAPATRASATRASEATASPHSAGSQTATVAPPPTPVSLRQRKPAWLRVPARMGDDFLSLKATMRELDLVTVCEEAGCPNIFECWSDGTATFMINGDRCTRSCGFCLVDTRRPLPVDPEEPARVAEAVARLRLAHAVVTAVARDDLPDGGAEGFAATVAEIRSRNPGCTVEILVPDCKGNPDALDVLYAARPDVLNHNLETVLRLHREVRPSASYARSLAVLAGAKSAGLTTKSGVMVGLGETGAEVSGALADLRGVGVDIVTIGQYLRPSAAHLPVARYWSPEEFDALGREARAMGFSHVEASPLTRSSYHARRALPVAAAAS